MRLFLNVSEINHPKFEIYFLPKSRLYAKDILEKVSDDGNNIFEKVSDDAKDILVLTMKH